MLFVPALRVKSDHCATGARHTFRRKGVPETFRARFLDEDDAPRAGLAYRLVAGAVERSGTTDSDGWLSAFIPPDAATATLYLADDEEYELALGGIDPIATTSGVQARLANLGYYFGAIDGIDSDELTTVVASFQTASELDPTGSIGDPTRAAIVKAYGS